MYKEWKLLLKGKKSGGGGQGRCERRIEAFVKIKKKMKKNIFFWRGGGRSGVGGRGGFGLGVSGWM